MSSPEDRQPEVRVDKWLQIARVFKSRSQATHACELGRVKVNGSVVKAHRRLQLEDRIEVQQKDWTRIVVVKELHDKPVPKAQAAQLYEDQSPPRPAADPLSRLMRIPAVKRDRGAGRPTKRERRQLDRWRDSSEPT